MLLPDGMKAKTCSWFFIGLDQQNVGVQLKVERASVGSVKDRLAMLKRKKDAPEEEEYGMECICIYIYILFPFYYYICYICILRKSKKKSWKGTER